MQSATGQYGTHAGDPAHPVQHSVMTASSFGFFFRGVAIPSDFGSILTTVGVMFELYQSPEVSASTRRPVRHSRPSRSRWAPAPSAAIAKTSAGQGIPQTPIP